MTTRDLLKNIALLVTCILAAASAQAQTTLYSDDFSGSGSLLNGAAVDVSNSLSTNWLANSAFLDNGATDGALSGSALLDVSLQPNAQYNLSVDILVNAVGGDWGGFGFASGDAATFIELPGADGGNVDRFTDGPGGRSWALFRDQTGELGAADVEFFGGASTANGINVDDTLDIVAGNSYDAELQLITAADGGSYTIELFVNGTSVLNGDGGLGTAATINNNISLIGSVGLTFNNTLSPGHTFDNFLLTEQILGAATNQWDIDGGGSFNNAANWSENTVPTSTATFGGVLTAANNQAEVTFDSPVSLSNVVFSNGAADYVIEGPNSLNLIGDATIATNTGRHWIRTPVTGSLGLNKTGAGELILDDANTFSGDISVAGGRLSVTDPNAIPSGADIALTSADANLLFGGDNGFFVDNGSTGGGYVGGTVNGVISGDGSVTVTLGATSTWTAANTFNGALTVEGTDTVLTLSGSGTPGASDGTTATETRIGGTAQIVLPGKAVGNEVLKLNERADAGTPAHLSSSGTSSWAGNIAADTPGDGSHYKIEATSGTLTLSGTLSAFDAVEPNDRYYVFGGSGNINVTGRISDYAADADGNLLDADMSGTPDSSAGDNLHVIKRGSGTLTINTATNNLYDYWAGNTTVEAGTLVLTATAGSDNELLSAVTTVQAGATLNVSSFADYDLGEGDALAGGGTVQVQRLDVYDDNILSPNGTLTIEGDVSLTGGFGGGALNVGLGSTAGVGDNIQINGSFTTADAPALTVQVTPIGGTLPNGGNYTLISHNAGTAAAVGAFTAEAVNNLGETLNPRQTFQVSSTTSQVRLQVSGTQSNLTWAGTSGNNTWDVATSTNWSGSNQFRDLDTVTFGSGGEKNVVVNSSVTPGSTTFNSASTYTFTGEGGITGYGPVNVNAGTVQLQNTGNDYLGTTTVASGATLEAVSASTGAMNINGTLALGKETSSILVDDFTGGLGSYTNTVILDTDAGGGANTATWQITDGAAEYNTTTYQSIEQSAMIRSALSLAIGEELQVDVDHTGASQDIGLYVGGTTPVAGTRQDYVSVYARANGQVFSRGFDGTTEYGLTGGDSPAYSSLFIARTGENTFEAGFYDENGRTVITTRTPATANGADVVGFYTDVRAAGVLGSVDNLRLVELGGTATLDINGDFTLGSTGTLELDITDSGYDNLDISGIATLTGEIAVSLGDGFTPGDGAEYTLLSAAGGIATALGSLDFGAGLPSGFTASYNDAMTELILTFAAGLGGDFNGDGIVNIADYAVWRNNLGANESVLPPGSTDGSTIVDAADYELWRTNFGMTTGALNTITSAPAAVPEPSSFVLLAGILVGGAVALRRRGIGQHSTV